MGFDEQFQRRNSNFRSVLTHHLNCSPQVLGLSQIRGLVSYMDYGICEDRRLGDAHFNRQAGQIRIQSNLSLDRAQERNRKGGTINEWKNSSSDSSKKIRFHGG